MPFANLEPVDRRATADVIAEVLRERIMDGSFEPGTQLTEAQLAEGLGVSRGPLREAFQRLVQEGLLDAAPHRGVFVARLGAEDVDDVMLARAAIERAAAERVARTGDRATLAALGRRVDSMAAAARSGRWSDVAESDLAFHEALVAGAGSPRLSRMYATLLVETRLCLRARPDQQPDPSAVVAEHRALLDALLAGDGAAAATCVAEHLSATTGADLS